MKIVIILLSCALYSTANGAYLPATCQTGWIKFKESCYYGYVYPMYTYREAEEVCTGMHSTLVIINDAEENLFLKAYTRNQYHIWIGLNDIKVEGKFVWADGSPLKYRNWNVGQPDNGSNREDCAHLVFTAQGRWNDWPCSHRAGFVCEQKPRWQKNTL
ncbi:low affinity immunoglobulin epsilon Fc receptor-like [Ptychodera flava]|uniref:low affinity immunoglobulin epsilon Fc receptor-like n=1 Tax=Ptychodera flava TaxID=63121 RepID=UPI003969F3E0